MTGGGKKYAPLDANEQVGFRGMGVTKPHQFRGSANAAAQARGGGGGEGGGVEGGGGGGRNHGWGGVYNFVMRVFFERLTCEERLPEDLEHVSWCPGQSRPAGARPSVPQKRL
jgi:hypothetical protein